MNAPLYPPQYCAPAAYYASMARRGEACIADGLRYDKRFKSTHRCLIPGNHGMIMLTVPTVKPHRADATWADVEVSDHGSWWSEHLTAMESTYGRTPYFEFYIDDFRQIIGPQAVGRRLTDFDGDLDTLIRRLLGISTEVSHSAEPLHPGSLCEHTPDLTIGQYWQIRPTEQSVTGQISVLDMLFCLGPEALTLLLDASRSPIQSR